MKKQSIKSIVNNDATSYCAKSNGVDNCKYGNQSSQRKSPRQVERGYK